MSAPEKPAVISAALVATVRRATGLRVLECRRYLEQLAPAHYAKLLTAIAQQGGGILHDPVEDDPAYSAVLADTRREAEALVDRQTEDGERDLRARGHESLAWIAKRGRSHAVWNAQQRLLRERHGLDWRTPAEMNPGVCFD